MDLYITYCQTVHAGHTKTGPVNFARFKKVGCFLKVPISQKKLLAILQETKKNDWQTVNIGRKTFQISCSIEKSTRCYAPIGWRWLPQCCKGTVHDCPGSQLSLSFAELLEVVCKAHFVYLNNIVSLWCLLWCWRLDGSCFSFLYLL